MKLSQSNEFKSDQKKIKGKHIPLIFYNVNDILVRNNIKMLRYERFSDIIETVVKEE